jgi:ABC-type proline/glycine betaine transport system substrate-binding protein
MAYVSQEMKSELAPAIKTILKKYGLKGSLAVRNHSTLALTIKSGKIDFAKLSTSDSHHHQVNTYWTDSHYTGKAKKFFAEVIAAMKGPKFFDHSDSMTDYFHCSHYIDINLGKWNKPYVLEK